MTVGFVLRFFLRNDAAIVYDMSQYNWLIFLSEVSSLFIEHISLLTLLDKQQKIELTNV